MSKIIFSSVFLAAGNISGIGADPGVGLKIELIETEDSVADIAYQSGFNNLANFNRRFAGLKQASPKAYRRQYTTQAV